MRPGSVALRHTVGTPTADHAPQWRRERGMARRPKRSCVRAMHWFVIAQGIEVPPNTHPGACLGDHTGHEGGHHDAKSTDRAYGRHGDGLGGTPSPRPEYARRSAKRCDRRQRQYVNRRPGRDSQRRQNRWRQCNRRRLARRFRQREAGGTHWRQNGMWRDRDRRREQRLHQR
jgi:hypothetical protein